MLNKAELKKFYKAVEIIDEYFDFNRFDTNKLNKVIELGGQNNLELVNVMLNKEGSINANELLEELFDITFAEINNAAHKEGYSKIY